MQFLKRNLHFLMQILLVQLGQTWNVICRPIDELVSQLVSQLEIL